MLSPGWLAVGQYLMTFRATASKRAWGMMLPGNGSRRKPEPLGLAWVVNGSKRLITWVALERVWEKFPARSRSVGTVVVVEAKLRSRRLSYAKKKNILLRWIGPPMLPPNWLRLKFGRAAPR